MDKNLFRKFFLIGTLILFSSSCSKRQLTPPLPDESPDKSTSPAEPSQENISSDESEPEPLHNVDGAKLVLIPKKSFLMGSIEGDVLADEDEFPQHQVTIDEYYIYISEVTNQMYAGCVEAGACMRPMSRETGPTSHYAVPEYAKNPVVGVDWLMARDYCDWVGGRLPTEAEWELASRGSEGRLYPWGYNEPTCDHVNMGGCTEPADSHQAGYYLLGNSLSGVWDMSGNVWEWVQDWYGEDYYSQSPEDNPVGPSQSADPEDPQRVVRGGGFNSAPDAMRSAARMGLTPYRAFSDVGFRCVVGGRSSPPAIYDPGRGRHERVPSDGTDGGDSADDPDSAHSFWAESTDGPCPDAFGMITLEFRMDSSESPTHVLLRYEGSWWGLECAYDAGEHTATCTVPAPPGYLDSPPTFPIDFCMTTASWGECITDLMVRKPSTCEGGGLLVINVAPTCAGDPGEETPIVYVQPLDIGDLEFSFARADGTLLSCPEIEEGIYHCSGLPGSPGDELEFLIGFSDDSVLVGGVVYPSCGGMDDMLPWDLVRVGCLLHGSAKPEYFAEIDTFLEATFTSWRLEDVEVPKICVEESPPGRWYCNFTMRNWYTTLTFCAEWSGGPGEICTTFPATEFGDRLPASCIAPEDPAGSCADFTTSTECDTHSECYWDKDDGLCRPLP